MQNEETLVISHQKSYKTCFESPEEISLPNRTLELKSENLFVLIQALVETALEKSLVTNDPITLSNLEAHVFLNDLPLTHARVYVILC